MGSSVLALASVYEIAIALPLSLLAYHLLGFRYLGALNGIALFLVIGIGVDDCFIFFNTFAQCDRSVSLCVHIHPRSESDLPHLVHYRSGLFHAAELEDPGDAPLCRVHELVGVYELHYGHHMVPSRAYFVG